MDSILSNENAFVILVNNDNSMTITQKRRIMQRSKLVDTLWFLVNPIYNEKSMSNFSVLLEYVLPNSRKYCSEILELSAYTYNDYLKYTLPLDTDLTSEAGDIELQLTFACADIDSMGNPVQLVRKVSGTSIHITPISAWSDLIPDSALSAIDQRLIKADAQIRALEELGDLLDQTKADNISYNSQTNELQLLSGKDAIGNIVTINANGSGDCSCEEEDCITVVEF